jgi:hypothetical protein
LATTETSSLFEASASTSAAALQTHFSTPKGARKTLKQLQKAATISLEGS